MRIESRELPAVGIIREQLGLRLEASGEKAEILVIDHVEKPHAD
jgi:uncharacterized protein (TIGR03435 family)